MEEVAEFGWVKRIGRNWVLNSQCLMGVAVYGGLAIVLVGFLAPNSWHLTWYGLGLCLTYPFAGALERWMFFHLIKCPKCGFNATHGKTTERPLNYYIAWSRLEKYNVRTVAMTEKAPNPTLKFAPSGRWDAPSARPLAPR